MGNLSIKKITKIGVVAAIYTAISIVAAPISFGSIQVRVAESLTILPVFSKTHIYGVTLGCFLTNIIGAFMGVNIAGFLDVFVGTSATLIAAYSTYALRNIKIKGLPILSAVPPVLINAIFIGYELSFVINGGFLLPAFLLTAFQVAVGQVISLTVAMLLFKFFVNTNIGDELKD